MSELPGAGSLIRIVRRKRTRAMAFVPDNVEWFLAQIVQEIRVAGSRRNIVHVNYVIIQAPSPELAYNRAMTIGKKGDTSYVNELGKQVTIRFRGLRDLDVIYDPLGDGCEIMFTEKLGVTKKGIEKLVRPKRELEVFLPIRTRPGRPNYSSKEIMEIVNSRLNEKK
jgi:hypothetical protein